MSEDAVTAKSLVHYGLIALPLSFAGLPLYIHMPDFYTGEFGIGIGVLGVALLAIRLFDALQDPLIGYVSDRMANRRRLIIFVGIVLLTAGMAGLSFGPPLSALAATWFTVFMLLATTGFSIVTINVTMLGGFWKSDNNQRARISAWREGFGLVGLLLAAILPTALQYQLPVKTSFIILFLAFVFFMAPASLLFQRLIQQVIAGQGGSSKPQASAFALFSILKGSDKLFFSLCFLSYLSASLPAVLVLFFIRDYLGAEHFSGLFLAFYFISGAAFISTWSKIANSYGLYNTWVYAMVLSIVTFVGATFLSPGDVIAYAIICILSGIALGADLALPPAIIAGRISGNNTEHQATQYYAVLAFLPKVAMAVAAGTAFLALEHADFQADSNNSDNALWVLLMAYALAPCLIKTLAAALLWLLIKTEGPHNEINQRSTDHGTTRIS